MTIYNIALVGLPIGLGLLAVGMTALSAKMFPAQSLVDPSDGPQPSRHKNSEEIYRTIGHSVMTFIRRERMSNQTAHAALQNDIADLQVEVRQLKSQFESVQHQDYVITESHIETDLSALFEQTRERA